MNKIDFVLFVNVDRANPNGDPLDGNRPRTDYLGYGEISDVCIKRKIRNRLQDLGQNTFVQSAERCADGYESLSERATKEIGKEKNIDIYAKKACEKWIDVRSFGQVFAFKADSVSVGVRGPVSIHQGVSISPVEVVSMQITKSVNSEPAKGKSSDTMGTKHYVKFGLYKIKGSINVQLAEKTGFNNDDAKLIKESLATLFENDSSSARPEGSMAVHKLFWFEHNSKSGDYSTLKVHNSVKATANVDSPSCADDYSIFVEPLD